MPKRLSTLLILLFICCIQISHAQQLDNQLERIQRATVFVMQVRNIGSDLIVTCIGTGTLVSRDGLILTNAHNTLVSNSCPGESLIIALTIRPDETPIPKYRAEIAQSDPGLDIALLRITRELDGRLIESQNLALPFVELADSAAIALDDTLTVVGYPGLGDEVITSTRGTIVGFTAEPRGGDKSWIKTSAVIPGTMSGGGAYDQNGRLIGIPTTAPLTLATRSSTCQPIQDTNRDGLVNTSDICIPIGGFINSLRPSNFAQPLLRAARLGLTLEPLTAPNTQVFSSGAPRFKRLFFSASVNEAGMPTSVIRRLPAGSSSLYLFFDYENMRPETVYELRVTTDGIPNPTFSLAPVRWSGGRNGLWYIGSSEQPWPNGIYEFTLFADGVAADTARLVIGSAPEDSPTFSDIVFGLLDLRNNVLGNGYVLPTGNIASARFIFRNMQNDTPWTAIWYYNGTEVFRTPPENVWTEGAGGSTTTSVRSDEGLIPGNYRLELYIQDRLAATSDFTIAGAQVGAFPQIFTNAHFTSAANSEAAISSPAVNNFPNTVDTLYALFDWQQIERGTLWTMRWSVDNEVFYEQNVPWNTDSSGTNFLVRLTDPIGIPDGTYKMDLLVNNVPLLTTQAQVGIGQLPIDRFAQASGVQMRGQILDAETQQGIPGVSFILLSEDFSIEDFVWDQTQIYAQTVTDRNGRFQIDRPLELAVPYSVVIVAEGYLPITADGVEIKPEDPNPIDMTIYLTRD